MIKMGRVSGIYVTAELSCGTATMNEDGVDFEFPVQRSVVALDLDDVRVLRAALDIWATHLAKEEF